MSSAVETAIDVRPFQVDVPDDALEDLRRRVAATNWPARESERERERERGRERPSRMNPRACRSP
jgi:hypothetical protein